MTEEIALLKRGVMVKIILEAFAIVLLEVLNIFLGNDAGRKKLTYKIRADPIKN